MAPESKFAKQRERMVEEQLLNRGIHDDRVLNAMRTVPRHVFVPKKDWPAAYEDRPLPIGEGQTISQPYMVALMSQLLQLKGREKVLEIGTGLGYQSAILGALAGKVHSIERVEALAQHAQSILKDLEISNVFVHLGDGSLGWDEEAPFDAIIVTAAAPAVPKPLLDQLAADGCLVLPVGSAHRQILQKWWAVDGDFQHEDQSPVAFVPLIGEHGWKGRS